MSSFLMLKEICNFFANLGTKKIKHYWISELVKLHSLKLQETIALVLTLNQQIKNVFFAFSAFENFSILVLIVLVVLFFKKPTRAQLPYLYFGIYFSVLLSILIGWTVPVLGAIVRYKIPCLPFAFSSLLLCIDFPKIKNYLKKQIQ